jgi:GNAT superfamily N-acetyltransferase
MAAHYALTGTAEIERSIAAGEVFIGEYNGKPAGFAGLHSEGSMGMLEVLPEFQRKGFGTDLEACMIGYVLKQGRIPYGHVIADNEKSMALQKKLGFTVCNGIVYWLS